jgi:arylsulfatase A-like enzyme
MYEELLHVPYLIYSPDIRSYKRVKTRVSVIDLVPTVLDLADIQWEGERDGVSLVPLMKRPSRERNEPVIANIDHPIQGKGYCIVDDNKKYIEFKYKEFSEYRLDTVSPLHLSGQELYYLDVDPRERTNMWSDSLALVTLQGKLYDAIRMKADPVTSEPKRYTQQIRGDLESQLRALGYIE